MALAGLHDLLDRLVVDVGHEERAGLAGAFQESRLEDDAVLVAIDDLVVVLPPAERAVDEELHALRPKDRIARHELAGIGDEMRARFQGEAVDLQPCAATSLFISLIKHSLNVLAASRAFVGRPFGLPDTPLG